MESDKHYLIEDPMKYRLLLYHLRFGSMRSVYALELFTVFTGVSAMVVGATGIWSGRKLVV